MLSAVKEVLTIVTMPVPPPQLLMSIKWIEAWSQYQLLR